MPANHAIQSHGQPRQNNFTVILVCGLMHFVLMCLHVTGILFGMVQLGRQGEEAGLERAKLHASRCAQHVPAGNDTPTDPFQLGALCTYIHGNTTLV